MECPYCGADLVCDDYYGKTVYAEHYYIYPRSWIEKTGDIYHCPNSEGFEVREDALDYADKNKDAVECFVKWDEIVCESSMSNGHFYTDKQDNLHEGYPC